MAKKQTAAEQPVESAALADAQDAQAAEPEAQVDTVVADEQPTAVERARARVLIDIPHLGARAGDVLDASAALIAERAAAGDVDPHPDAVAYALAKGANVSAFS